MNKEEYLSALEQELMVLPLEERLSALQYYKDYFDDAGKDNEAKVISELGSPNKVASDILKEYQELSTEVKTEPKIDEHTHVKQPIGVGRGILLVIVGLLLIPIGLPLFFAVIGLIIAFIAVIFSLFLCVLLLAIAFFLSGIAIVVKGAITFFVTPIDSLFVFGVGLFFIGLGMLTGMLFVKICTSILPSMFRLFIDICRRPFNYRKGVKI